MGVVVMDFWPEFLACSWGREFVAGGFGGIAGIISGYPLDTLRVRQQHSNAGSAFRILRNVIAAEGPAALYRGMGAPLASVTIQVFFSFVSLLVLINHVSIFCFFFFGSVFFVLIV
jgi:solute carrier family 25 carnitine/acylcarnitine transporter 20/29